MDPLKYRLEGTATAHMAVSVPLASPVDKVGDVLVRLHGLKYDAADTIYVVDKSSRLKGVVPMTLLLSAQKGERLNRLMSMPPASAKPGDDQEQAALMAVRTGMDSLPVVDEKGKLLGIIPPHTLTDILRREQMEDLDRLVGILRENHKAVNATEISPLIRVKNRLPWLVLGLLGSMVATYVVSSFEKMLERRISVAFFIPAIVYLADAIGTQTEAVTVRGLSAGQTNLKKLLVGELQTGMLIGLSMGLLIYPYSFFFFNDNGLALSVSIAVFAAGSLATSIGALFPWLLLRLGSDPAFGSGPVATIIQDVLSLYIYFTTVSMLAL